MSMQILRERLEKIKRKPEAENTLTFDFTDAKKCMKGNQPEDWLELVDHVNLNVEFPNTYQRHNVMSDLFEQAFKEIDPKLNRNNEAYAHLFVKYARLKSKHLSEDAAVLFNQARSISRKYAIVHIASAQFEIDRDDLDKARKILTKAKMLGAEPVSDVVEALKELGAGNKTVYLSPLHASKLTAGRKHSSGSESTDEVHPQLTDNMTSSLLYSIASQQKETTEPSIMTSVLKKPGMRTYRSTPVLNSEKKRNVIQSLPGRVKKINLPFQMMREGGDEEANSTTNIFKSIDTKPLDNHTTNGNTGLNHHGHTSGYLSMTCDSTIPLENEHTGMDVIQENVTQNKQEEVKLEPVKIQAPEPPRRPLAPKQLEPETPNCKQEPVPSTPLPQMKTITVNDQHYIVLGVLGKGGSCKVYQCFTTSNKLVAVKCVNLDHTQEKVVEGYKNEIKLLKRLQYCDQVITMYDSEFNAVENKLYVVMETGSEDLAAFFRSQINNKKKLSEHLIRYYWEIMLESVQALHKEGIIHSDLKPANFLFVGGKLKLIDFGIAKALQQDKTSVILDTQMGTLNYMSPETIMDSCGGGNGQGKPKFKIGVKSDVWSLGCILYNMVYMRTPFQHLKHDLFKLQAIMNPDFPIEFPDLPNKHLIDVLKKCLNRDPKSRPSVDELLSHPYLSGGSKNASPQIVKNKQPS